jgi:hypothetical protein
MKPKQIFSLLFLLVAVMVSFAVFSQKNIGLQPPIGGESLPKSSFSAMPVQAPHNSESALELNFPELALKSPAKVQRTLGKPLSIVIEGAELLGVQHDYDWGFVVYERGKLTLIDYGFKSHPISVTGALGKLGLESNSMPHEGPFTYYWNSETQGLICCGFEFDTVVVPKDLSRIAVGVKRRHPR